MSTRVMLRKGAGRLVNITLQKAAGHKYVKRELKDPGPPRKYRYWYRDPAGGLVTSDSLHEGASFRHGKGEDAGHYHIKKVEDHPEHGKRVFVAHDETGHEQWMTHDELRDHIHEQRKPDQTQKKEPPKEPPKKEEGLPTKSKDPEAYEKWKDEAISKVQDLMDNSEWGVIKPYMDILSAAREKGQAFDLEQGLKQARAQAAKEKEEKEAKLKAEQMAAEKARQKAVAAHKKAVNAEFSKPRTLETAQEMSRSFSGAGFNAPMIVSSLNLFTEGDDDKARELARNYIQDKVQLDAFLRDPESYREVMQQAADVEIEKRREESRQRNKEDGDKETEKHRVLIQKSKDIMAQAKDKTDGWEMFTPERTPEQQQYLDNNKEKIQELWDKFRIPVIPPYELVDANAKIPDAAFEGVVKILKDVGQAFDVRSVIEQAALPLSFDPTLDTDSKELAGRYDTGTHILHLVKPEDGSTFLHELFHGLDMIAGNGKLLSNPDYFYQGIEGLAGEDLSTKGFLDDKMAGHQEALMEGKEYMEYQALPHERLARMFEDFLHLASGSDKIRKVGGGMTPKGKVGVSGGYWGSEAMADRAEEIAAIGKRLGVNFKPEYVARVKAGEQHENITGPLKAHKEKEEAEEKAAAEYEEKRRATTKEAWKNAEGKEWQGLPTEHKDALFRDMEKQKMDMFRDIREAGKDKEFHATGIHSRFPSNMDATWGEGKADPRPAFQEMKDFHAEHVGTKKALPWLDTLTAIMHKPFAH